MNLLSPVPLAGWAALVVALSCSSCQTNDQLASLRAQPSSGTRFEKSATVSATRVNEKLLSESTHQNSRVVVDVEDQKGYLLVDERIALESPVSTGRPGKWTPRGSFNVTERVRQNKISTIYGVEMPYWMRLSGSVYGLHHGYLPGYPASAGCIRFPQDAAQLIYDHTTYGTRVNIYSEWEEPAPVIAGSSGGGLFRPRS